MWVRKFMRTHVGDMVDIELFYCEDGRTVAVKIPLCAFYHEGLSEYITASEEDRFAESISVDRNGIELGLEEGFPRYAPHAWAWFWKNKEVGERGYNGLQAVEAWNRWRSFLDDGNVDYFLQLVSEGRMAFEDLREIDPSLFEHPRIMSALTIAFRNDAMPIRRRGKKRRTKHNVVELYGWAHWYYRVDNLTWERACERACSCQANLVPDTWEGDAVVNLQREAARYLDTHPLYGQLKREEDR